MHIWYGLCRSSRVPMLSTVPAAAVRQTAPRAGDRPAQGRRVSARGVGSGPSRWLVVRAVMNTSLH